MQDDILADSVAALSERLRADDLGVRQTAAKALFEHFRAPLRRHIRCELARTRPAQPVAEKEAFHSRVETHVNSALVKLLERLERGPLGAQDEVHFLAYLKAIVRNAMRTRRGLEDRSRMEPAHLMDEQVAGEPSVLEGIASAEERTLHEHALAERRQRLTEEEQRLLDLYGAGRSYRQIAEQLGGSPGQHRARMSRILRKLR